MRIGMAALCVLVVTCSADLAQADRHCLQISKVSMNGSHQRLACYRDPWYASSLQFSRDHRYLYAVESAVEHPGPRIWVARVDGSSSTLLLTAPANISGIRLSPDSRRIAFVTFADNNDANGGLWVVNSDETGLRRLSPTTPLGLSWAPDSRRLAVGQPRPGPIKIIDVDTGSERALTAGSIPQWSPDGRFIVFQAGANIGLVRPDGGARRILARGSSPQWLADGRRLSFLRREASSRALWIVSPTGGRPLRVRSRADRPRDAWSVTWSPQGAKFAYEIVNWRPRKWSGLVVASSNRKPRLLRVEANRTTQSLSWSRNGESILYVSQFIRTD